MPPDVEVMQEAAALKARLSARDEKAERERDADDGPPDPLWSRVERDSRVELLERSRGRTAISLRVDSIAEVDSRDLVPDLPQGKLARLALFRIR